MERKNIFEVSTPKQWKTIPKSKLRDEGYAVYGANGKIGFYLEYNHEEPTILITCRGATCGEINISEPYSYITGNAMCLDDLSDEVELKYLYYFLKKRDMSDVISGSAQPQITKTNLNKIDIPLPSRSEQNTIVAKLDRVQRLIDIDRDMLVKYDKLTQSVFLEMFGDPVRNPKGWETKRIDEFSTVQIGPFGSLLHKEDYIENGIPLINPKNIVGSRIITDDEKTITNQKAKELSKYILEENDIVLGRRGDMGRCAVVTAKENGYLCGTGSILIRSELNPILLSKILSSNSMVSQLEEIANGVTMKNLNSKIVSSLEIPIPPDEIIKQYEIIINSIESEKINQKSLLKKSEELFSSLVQGAFKYG